MAFDPITSVILAVTILDESLHESTVGAVVSCLALAAALGGMVVLARNQEETVAAKPGAGTAVAVLPPAGAPPGVARAE
jgi:hypothetical protein